MFVVGAGRRFSRRRRRRRIALAPVPSRFSSPRHRLAPPPVERDLTRRFRPLEQSQMLLPHSLPFELTDEKQVPRGQKSKRRCLSFNSQPRPQKKSISSQPHHHLRAPPPPSPLLPGQDAPSRPPTTSPAPPATPPRSSRSWDPRARSGRRRSTSRASTRTSSRSSLCLPEATSSCSPSRPGSLSRHWWPCRTRRRSQSSRS